MLRNHRKTTIALIKNFPAMHPRITRVNTLLREAFAHILQKYYREESTAITITRMAISSDLHHATVYMSLMGNEPTQKQSLRWLHKKKPELRRRLNQEVVLKFSPELHFALDDSHLQEMRVTSLLMDMANESPIEIPDPTNSMTS
jgi:ribosome-binding factor A